MDLTISERLVLAAFDRDKGKTYGRAGTGLPPALAGALVVDLLEAGSATLDGDDVVATDQLPDAGPVVADAWASLRERGKPVSVRRVVERPTHLVKHLPAPVLDQLVGRGVLVSEGKRSFLSRERYELVDDAPVRELVAHLEGVLDGEAKPTTGDLVVLAVLGPCEITTAVFPDRKARDVTKRVKALVESAGDDDEIAGEVAAEVQRTVVATVAAVVAATTAGIAAAGSS